MKKASKFLSMFLLVAMCLSLMGGAAYADSYSDSYSGTVTTNTTVISGDSYSGSVSSSSATTSYPALYTSSELVWQTTAGSRATLAEIAKLSATAVTLQADTEDGDVTLSKNYVINLNGNTWTVTDPVYVTTSMTIKNGTIVDPENIRVIGGTLTVSNVKGSSEDSDTLLTKNDFTNVSDDAAVKIDNSIDPIAVIGSTGYASADEAFAAASTMTGNVTITFPNYDNMTSDYELTTVATIACDTLTLVLNNNSLDLGENLTLNSNLNVSGYKLKGDVTVTSKNVTLASGTNVEGTITDTNGTVTVAGGTVDEIALTNGTLVMGSGKIGTLTLDGANTLNVSGGTVGTEEEVTLLPTLKTAAVTGGTWNLGNSDESQIADQIAYLKLNANNRTITNNGDGTYTVGTSSNSTSTVIVNGTTSTVTGSNDSYSQVAGTYTASGDSFNYTTTVSGNAAIWPSATAVWKSGNGNLYFKYSPNTAAANGLSYTFFLDSTAWVIPGDQYTDNLAGTMSIGSELLATLSEGTHTVYLQVVENGVTYQASCTFYVGASLKAVDTDKHVINSTKSLQFVCSQPISRVWVGSTEITDDYGTYYTLSANRKTITLTADFLNARTAGNTYTLTVQTTGGDQPSATFQILTTAQASSSPKTGDSSNLALWAAVLVLSGGAAVAVLPRLKKNEG